MRTREEIEGSYTGGRYDESIDTKQSFILEVLLDIRELLQKPFRTIAITNYKEIPKE